MATIAGCILLGICFAYWYFSKVGIMYMGLIFLCILVFCEPFIIRKYQIDIEGTDKKHMHLGSILQILIILLLLRNSEFLN